MSAENDFYHISVRMPPPLVIDGDAVFINCRFETTDEAFCFAFPHTPEHPCYGNEKPIKPIVVEDPPDPEGEKDAEKTPSESK